MDAATITAWLSGIGLVLKAAAVLVSAIRARAPKLPPDTQQDDSPALTGT
jgi:hypothetical protein